MDRLRPRLEAARQRSLAVYRSLYFPPTVICAAILVASVFGWQAAKQSLAHDLRIAAETRVFSAEQSIQNHVSSYEQILRGGVGLFQGSSDVTGQDWNNYLDAFNVTEKYPGVQGIGFAKVVKADELPAVKEYLAEQGITNFQINPVDPPRDVYAPSIYLKLVAAAQQPTYGFDMYFEETRREAMFLARDENRSTITPRIQLMTTGSKARPNGFNMYAPVYGTTDPDGTQDRRDQIRGYVYASFRADVFFNDIVEDLDTRALGFDIHVKGDKQALYTSPTFKKINDSGQRSIVEHDIAVYGQTWHIRYALDHHLIVSNVQLRRPGAVLFFGIFSAALVSLILYLVLRGRARDLTAQKERAVELAKDELLSLASHQLRTPATGVKQYVGMVLQGFVGDISPEQKTLLEKAYASNDRQLRIINEILHLAKIDSGRIVLARQATNLGDLVNDVVNEQRADITASNHSVKLKLPKRPIIINADSHMLRMAIENLLSNAIKYTDPGGKLSVVVHRTRMHAEVSVTDNGIGIEDNDIAKIFNQFSRLPNEMSQRVEGTGIGLYLAKHLVELHKGTIQVISEPGKGSTFTVILPLRTMTTMRNLTANRES
jgi:signal transduction histidine kinase